MSFQAPCSPSIGVIVPITRMAGKLSNLRNWIPKAIEIGINVYLVHDVQDSETSAELSEMTKSFDSSHVHLVEEVFNSPGLARNRGLDLATEDWIYFWDADDIPNPEASRRVLQEIPNDVLSRNNIVVSQFEVVSNIDGNGIAQSKAHYKEALNFQDLARNVGLWRCAFRNSSILHKFNETKMGEDQRFLESNIDIYKTIFVPEYVYRYVVGVEGQLTSNKKFMSDLLKNNTPQIQNKKEDRFNFFSILTVRQLLTLIRFGKGGTRFRSLSRLIRIFLHTPHRTLIAISFIVRNSGYGSSSRTINNRKFVLTGGLGNQLFQLAAALSTSSDGNLDAYTSFSKPRKNLEGSPDSLDFSFPFEIRNVKTQPNHFVNKVVGYSLRSGIQPNWFEKYLVSQLLISVVGSIVLSFHLRTITPMRRAKNVGYENLSKINDRTILIGYFQSYLYMLQNPTTRMAMEKMTVTNPSKEFRRLVEIVKNVKPTIVHIRLGDYLAEKDFGILGSNYYKEAVKVLDSKNSDRTYWIFSDDIEMAQSRFGHIFNANSYWVTDKLSNSAETLEIMRHGSDFVIANSTFSWWAATLAYDKNSLVLSPNRWFAGLPEPKEIIPPEWIRLEPDFL